MKLQTMLAIMSALGESGIKARVWDGSDRCGIAPQPAPKQLTHADQQRLAAAEAKRQRKAAKRNGK